MIKHMDCKVVVDLLQGAQVVNTLEKYSKIPVTTKDEREVNRRHQLCFFGVIL